MKVKTPAGSRPKMIQFTEEGYRKIQADFDRLTEQRKEVLIRLQAAREMGDLSENGAYHAAKFELGSVDRQLRRLTYQLLYGKVTESAHRGIADFGSRVTLTDGKKEIGFTLVNGYESDPKQQKLSVISPLGKAVLGKKTGDTVTVDAPAGTLSYTIKEIE